ncbi:MAG TPA: glycosyltransferase family 4 protein [Anaerolineales bacterium]|nr:glycosyltransferase family 4 protein [Anaerolineales bacterium]
MLKVLLFANTDWYLYNFRLALAKNLLEQGYSVVLLSPPGEFKDKLQAQGFQWISFPLSRQGVNPFTELWTLWRLIQLYQRIRPNLVHHFTIKPVIYGSLAARLVHIPYIVNSITGLGHIFIDSNITFRILRGIAKILYRLSLRHTQVIFENPEDRDFFIQHRLIRPEQSHLILGAGVDVEKFRPTTKQNEIPLVLFASRLLVTKGILEFVEAARWLKKKGVKARFVIVGTPDEGNPASVPQEQIDSWKRSNDVEVWGWQDDMPAVLAQADIFCLPSYREGVPNALLEACACGLPIVTTNVPGCRDVVQHGVNGLLVAPRDALSLAGALDMLLTDPALRLTMGKAGRQIALECFSLNHNITQTMAVYLQMFGSGKKHS